MKVYRKDADDLVQVVRFVATLEMEWDNLKGRNIGRIARQLLKKQEKGRLFRQENNIRGS